MRVPVHRLVDQSSEVQPLLSAVIGGRVIKLHDVNPKSIPAPVKPPEKLTPDLTEQQNIKERNVF